MIKKIALGISRHPKRFFLAIAFGYATLWAILEPLFSILEIKTAGYHWGYLALYILASIIISIFVIYPKKKVQFDLKNTNTKVEIVFDDLFKSKGHKVIAVSQFFDSKIGKPVSKNSLHGIFIEQILGGHFKIIDEAVSSQLNGKEIALENRVDGKNLKYEIGTTITINHTQNLYFLFALAISDNECNTSSTPSLMLKALEGLWSKVRVEGNGEDINLPLLGNGLARIGLPQSQLLQLILISILKATKEKDLSSTIRIVLRQDTFDKIDLQIIKTNWQ